MISVSSSHQMNDMRGDEFNPGMNAQALDLNDSITTKPIVEVTNPDGSSVPHFKPVATETSIQSGNKPSDKESAAAGQTTALL